jgi:hypothetical protein
VPQPVAVAANRADDATTNVRREWRTFVAFERIDRQHGRTEGLSRRADFRRLSGGGTVAGAGEPRQRRKGAREHPSTWIVAMSKADARMPIMSVRLASTSVLLSE